MRILVMRDDGDGVDDGGAAGLGALSVVVIFLCPFSILGVVA